MYSVCVFSIFFKIYYEYHFIRDAGKNSIYKHEEKIENAFKNKN